MLTTREPTRRRAPVWVPCTIAGALLLTRTTGPSWSKLSGTDETLDKIRHLAPPYWFFDASAVESGWQCSSCPYRDEVDTICPIFGVASARPKSASMVVRSPECTGPGHQDVSFVSTFKTATMFMQGVLSQYSLDQTVWAKYDPDDTICYETGTAMGWHHANVWHQQQLLGADVFDAAFTISIARNPFSRQVSMYCYFTRRAAITPAYLQFAGMDRDNSPECFNPSSEQVEIACFRKWVRGMYAHHPPGSATQYLFGGPPLGNARGNRWLNATQTSYLLDDEGRIAVDLVCRLEDIAGCWPTIQKHVCGLRHISYATVLEQEEEGGDLVMNSNPHAPYREFYDRTTQDIVAQYTSADLINFGYTEL